MDDRRVWMQTQDIPDGVKIMRIAVRDPRIMLISPEHTEPEVAQYTNRFVFVELTQQEWDEVSNEQDKIDDLAVQFGDLVKEFLGSPSYHWVQPHISN